MADVRIEVADSKDAMKANVTTMSADGYNVIYASEAAETTSSWSYCGGRKAHSGVWIAVAVKR